MNKDCGCKKIQSTMELEIKDSKKGRRGRKYKNRMRKGGSVLDKAPQNLAATSITVLGNRGLVKLSSKINEEYAEAIGAGLEMGAGIAYDEMWGGKNSYADETAVTMAKHGSVELIKELGAKKWIDEAITSASVRIGNFFRGTSTSDNEAAIQAAIQKQAEIDAQKQAAIGGGADF